MCVCVRAWAGRRRRAPYEKYRKVPTTDMGVGPDDDDLGNMDDADVVDDNVGAESTVAAAEVLPESAPAALSVPPWTRDGAAVQLPMGASSSVDADGDEDGALDSSVLSQSSEGRRAKGRVAGLVSNLFGGSNKGVRLPDDDEAAGGGGIELR